MVPMTPWKLLFICVANTCRSPIAEAIARAMGGARVEAFSAGLSPSGWVSENALAALTGLGYDPRGLWSKGLDAVPLAEMDVIVSLIGEDGLRFVPSNLTARRESWVIRDPYGEDEAMFVATARILERNIRVLLGELDEQELVLS
jgi:protein-tyrosine-phosphatase